MSIEHLILNSVECVCLISRTIFVSMHTFVAPRLDLCSYESLCLGLRQNAAVCFHLRMSLTSRKLESNVFGLLSINAVKRWIFHSVSQLQTTFMSVFHLVASRLRQPASRLRSPGPTHHHVHLLVASIPLVSLKSLTIQKSLRGKNSMASVVISQPWRSDPALRSPRCREEAWERILTL